MPEIVAIDLGYGHTKVVSQDRDGEIKRMMFPSVAPITTRERTAEANGMGTLRTVTVCVGPNNYVIGKDAYLEADSNYSRSRLDEYSQTDGYHALMLGALALTGLREIDQLVIGLPLTTLDTYHSVMSTKYLGEHSIGATYARRKVELAVRNVLVTSQPAGAMINAVASQPGLKKATNLVIDMGYFTMDFLMCEGLRPFYKRSGAVQGGMSGYYDHLNSMVVEKITSEGLPAQSTVDHFRLEEALSNGIQGENGRTIYSLRIGRLEIDITECVERASTRLSEYLDRMMTTLGGGSSMGLISSVVLAGGGARMLLPAVRDRFGKTHDIVMQDSSQYAIANGFLHFGIASAKRAAAQV